MNGTKKRIKTRIISAVIALLITVPTGIFGDWPFFLVTLFVTYRCLFEVVRVMHHKFKVPMYIFTIFFGMLITYLPGFEGLINSAVPINWHIFNTFSSLHISIALLFISACILLLITIH